jgi:PPM family protein phosphatase
MTSRMPESARALANKRRSAFGFIGGLLSRRSSSEREEIQANNASRLFVDCSMETNLGLHREENEDSIGFQAFTNSDLRRGEGFLAIVADGMGGHVNGKEASRLAVETVMRVYAAERRRSPRKALEVAFKRANAAIVRASGKSGSPQRMGTTCTAISIESGRAIFAHVGDSRLYFWRAGELIQVSSDHTMVSRMVADGLISQEEAERHPDRNVLLRALGVDVHAEPDILSIDHDLNDGDMFCLCSDGLSGLVDASTIARALGEQNTTAACRVLLEAALANGGYDNISVGVIRVQSEDPLRLGRPVKDTRQSQSLGGEEE